MNKEIAVSADEFKLYGCINCGCEYCFGQGMSGHGCFPVECGECHTRFTILSTGIKESCIGINDYFPVLEAHPRYGILKHKFENPDARPEVGEYFKPRGVGYDLAGFVVSKKAGERIIKLFESILGENIKTWLDYREYEPTWIQVKVQEDDIDIKLLNKLTQDGIITKEKIRQCVKSHKEV